MRESRLFQIIYYILEKGRATAPELAKKFEVSVRTIYRDVDVISSAGIPVYVSTGRNGGIQILDGYVLEKVLFSEQEKQDFRLFKLNRIVSCELLEETFTPVRFPDLQRESPPPSEKLILRFPPEMAYRVYDEFHDSEITLQENGELLVTAYMPNDVWLIGYLLSFGSRVFVVEPAHLRKLLAKEGKKIYKNNKP